MFEIARRRWATTGAVLCSSMAIACGSTTAEQQPDTPPQTQRGAATGPAGPVDERGGDEVTATVGSAGGTLRLANGAKFEIPAGALGQRKQVTFSVGAPTKVFRHRPNEQTIGPILEVQPALTAAPGKRFVLSIPFTAIPGDFSKEDLVLAVETLADQQRSMGTGVRTRWRYFPAKVENGRLQGTRAEMPGMRARFLLSK